MKKDEILKRLRQDGGYVSGQELCEQYGVSRTAVWKAIKQLEKDGYTIEAVTNKGYRLVESGGEQLSQVGIDSYMDTQWVGRNLVFRRETGSTNMDAKVLAEEGAPAGTLVVADMQTAGRGRRGRGWVSAAGLDIYMSLLLRPSCMPQQASALTLVMALAVLEAVRELASDGVGIKWPNDVVLNGKKLCGILTEMSAEPDGIHYVVTGVGINTNRTELDEEIRAHATSLIIETEQPVNRARLIARVMYYYEKAYEAFACTWDLTGLMGRYNAFLVNMDREVRVLDPKGEYEGIARGINEKGELIVERAGGARELVYAGEVSVRGLYGYT
ncbi:MAG: biotin--[acetyl-CoA-carboxylase] ligase [Roseburia sp.]|nr:biotin--[acetyl-CoA-carboxylase] ligase [Roseburia sp.]